MRRASLYKTVSGWFESPHWWVSVSETAVAPAGPGGCQPESVIPILSGQRSIADLALLQHVKGRGLHWVHRSAHYWKALECCSRDKRIPNPRGKVAFRELKWVFRAASCCLLQCIWIEAVTAGSWMWVVYPRGMISCFAAGSRNPALSSVPTWGAVGLGAWRTPWAGQQQQRGMWCSGGGWRCIQLAVPGEKCGSHTG